MRYSVLLDGEVIGRSTLEFADRSMGVVFGRFEPTDAFRQVQPVFLLFAEGRFEQYYEARNALNLELRSETGIAMPTNVIHIVDHSNELGLDGMELEVHLTDEASWETPTAR